MKRKSIKKAKITSIDPIFDLFGDVIVTHFDLYIWVAVITKGRFLGNLKRYNQYIDTWNVAYKVKRSKLNGSFKNVVSEYYLDWHEREWRPDHLKAA